MDLERLVDNPFDPLESVPSDSKDGFPYGYLLTKEDWGFAGYFGFANLLRLCP